MENPISYIAEDAHRTLNAAKQAGCDGRVNDEASFSRSAAVLYFMALRGLVNAVYECSGVPNHKWRNLATHTRWSRVAELCLPRLEQPGEALQFPRDHVGEDLPLLERFLELRDAV